MNILEAQNVSKAFTDHVALKNLDLSIPKGSIFGLLGPNGAGKTTFIRIVNQIITRDSGEITINGELLNQQHIYKIGYLPEERGLYKKMKVGEQLLYLARLKGVNKTAAVQKIRNWLTRFDMMDWRNKNIEDLSKGMQQKIQFIAAVIHDPQLIILDEPFTGFDPINANLIKDEIFKLRDQGSTIIFSTHRMESVEELCDHIALINKSQKILEGEKSTIKSQFRANTFEVDYEGEISQSTPGFLINDTIPLNERLTRTNITIQNGESPNQLLSQLIQQCEVHSFVEKTPTINEIFISKVKQQSGDE